MKTQGLRTHAAGTGYTGSGQSQQAGQPLRQRAGVLTGNAGETEPEPEPEQAPVQNERHSSAPLRPSAGVLSKRGK